MSLHDLAETLRAQANKLDANLGPHVRGMRAGLLLAAVEVQHHATETETRIMKDYLT